ncbi:MAG: transcription factor S [Candidatus Aenigmarchaeota archaeon]|nr:transcription factor S [Candidatus Aenigmarchaeota archaeon]
MKLCQKCGSLLAPVKNGNKIEFFCHKCNKKQRIDKESIPKFTEKIDRNPQDEIPIIEKQTNVLPITQEDCPECGHNEARWWTQQTRSSDEPETRFYRCTKCNKTWREYS